MGTMNITLDDLTKVYRSRFFRTQTVALNHLSLTIEMGMFGLLGPNGAGKTTLMRVLATLLQPTSGAAYVGDWKVDDRNQKWKIRAQLGYLPQEIQMYDNLSAREFLAFVAALKRIPRGGARPADRENVGVDRIERRGWTQDQSLLWRYEAAAGRSAGAYRQSEGSHC